MRIVRTTRRFRRDYAKLKRSGRRTIVKLHSVMEQLVDGKILSSSHKDHALRGEWTDFRDCHVEGDWILVYQISFDEEGHEVVTFHATDNHSNLFD